MVHNIRYKGRNTVTACYLPEGDVPDKNAAAELHRMTALEELLKRLVPVPGFFSGRWTVDHKNNPDTGFS